MSQYCFFHNFLSPAMCRGQNEAPSSVRLPPPANSIRFCEFTTSSFSFDWIDLVRSWLYCYLGSSGVDSIDRSRPGGSVLCEEEEEAPISHFGDSILP